MFTPWRATILAVVIGIGAAAWSQLHGPPPPPVEQYTEAPTQSPTTKPAMTLAQGPKHVTPSGLTIIETKEGNGPAAVSGDHVVVHYIGRLYYGGEQFDSSYDSARPLHFQIGADPYIKGFDAGLVGLKVGGKRELVIPAALGYGDVGYPQANIPPGATLVFDIELVALE